MKRNDRVEIRRHGERATRRGSEADLSPRHRVTPSPCRDLAKACGIPIKYETLPLAFGRVIYLAEASLQPPSITVNKTAIAKLVEAAEQAPAKYREWFTEAAITEVAVAHELFHILTQQPSNRQAESLAHEFAQKMTGLPFSPHVYEALLKPAAGCQITKNIF